MVHCHTCGKKEGPLFACGQCERAIYCSDACAARDWDEGGHERECFSRDRPKAYRLAHAIFMDVESERVADFGEADTAAGRDTLEQLLEMAAAEEYFMENPADIDAILEGKHHKEEADDEHYVNALVDGLLWLDNNRIGGSVAHDLDCTHPAAYIGTFIDEECPPEDAAAELVAADFDARRLHVEACPEWYAEPIEGRFGEALGRLKQRASAAVQKAKARIRAKAAQLKQKAAQKLRAAKEKLKGAAARAKLKIKQGAARLRTAARNARERIKKGLGKAGQKIKAGAKKVVEKVKTGVRKAGQKIKAGAQKLRTRAGQLAQKARAKASALIQRGKAAFQRKKQQLSVLLNKKKQQLLAKFRQGKERVLGRFRSRRRTTVAPAPVAPMPVAPAPVAPAPVAPMPAIPTPGGPPPVPQTTPQYVPPPNIPPPVPQTPAVVLPTAPPRDPNAPPPPPPRDEEPEPEIAPQPEEYFAPPPRPAPTQMAQFQLRSVSDARIVVDNSLGALQLTLAAQPQLIPSDPYTAQVLANVKSTGEAHKAALERLNAVLREAQKTME